jgi:hypothetical protein
MKKCGEANSLSAFQPEFLNKEEPFVFPSSLPEKLIYINNHPMFSAG